MKKNLLFLLIALLATGMCYDAVAQAVYYKQNHAPKQQAFYFYPRSNVYYDISARMYYYPFKNGWAISKNIPARFVLKNNPRFTVYHAGANVWADNRSHRYIYKKYIASPVMVYQQPVRVVYR